MREKTCCFTGHRYILENKKEEIKDKTKEEVIKLINKGVIYFGTGGAIGYDTIAAEIVLELKEIYSNIKLILILPCFDQTKGWKEKDIEKYSGIKKKADKVRVLSERYYIGCMHTRNRYMVDNSAYCICYCKKTSGGTFYTVNYALKNNTNVIYI